MATKVVDSTGKPQPVYHGTTKAFGDFDPKHADQSALYGPGFYFTDDPSIASSYADAVEVIKKSFLSPDDLQDFIAENPNLVLRKQVNEKNPGIRGMVRPYDVISAEFFDSAKASPNVKPVYLNIQNPFDMDNVRLSPEQLKGIGWEKYYGAYSGSLKQIIQNNPKLAAGLPAALKSLGYDGIMHQGGEITGGKAHRVWIAFDPSQIINRYGGDQSALAWVRQNCKFANA